MGGRRRIINNRGSNNSNIGPSGWWKDKKKRLERRRRRERKLGGHGFNRVGLGMALIGLHRRTSDEFEIGESIQRYTLVEQLPLTF